jgi:thioredoxin 1
MLDVQHQLQTLTSETFDTLVLDGDGPIAVEFMSYGCVHCRALEPVLQQVAESIKSTEAVFRVNVAAEQDLAAKYQIDGTPTLVMFLNGGEVGRVEGPHPSVSSVTAALTQPFAA